MRNEGHPNTRYTSNYEQRKLRRPAAGLLILMRQKIAAHLGS